ncbi:MAG: glycerate kinase [Proteobacteria bacterium]|nr:MAG: glycerate kinase [Pseudomonadota bacterium]
MKIVIAPDSFKECLSAEGVAKAIANGWRKADPSADITLLPVADGGEGTADTLLSVTNGQRFNQLVTGPLASPVNAFWGVLGSAAKQVQGNTAIIEMAAASGLDLLPPKQRNPLATTTWGTGELILAALDHGVERIIIGLGGSATNDGGAGMLQALGVLMLDGEGRRIPLGGGGLSQLESIDISGLDPRLKDVRFEVACDVDNPLVGPDGASAVFGPQKGATPEQVKVLDANLQHFAKLTLAVTGNDVANVAGAGAAGGLGGAFWGYLNATLRRGIDIVLDAVSFEQHLEAVDLVITGEGRMDRQSAYGKTPVGVARRTKAFGNIPVIALAGELSEGAEDVYEHGIDAVFSIAQGVSNLESALAQAESHLSHTTENIARVVHALS